MTEERRCIWMLSKGMEMRDNTHRDRGRREELEERALTNMFVVEAIGKPFDGS